VSDAVFATVVRPALITAVLPAAAALAGVAAARLAAGKKNRDTRWLTGLGLAAGVTAAFVLIAGRPSWPPKDVVHWLGFALAAGLLVGVLDGLRTWPRLVRLTLHGLLLAGTVAALLQPLAKRWEPGRTGLWLGSLALAALLLWWLLDRPARKLPLPFALVPLTVAAGAFAGVMALSGSAKSSQLSGALAAGLGALALAAFARKLPRADGAPLAVAVAGLAGVMSHAQLYTEVHPAATALAASAGFAGGLGRIPFVGLLPKRRNLLAGFVLAALPAAAALLFAWSRFEPNPYGGY
jgi:hypothetical protein